MGVLSVVGIGPGGASGMTLEAVQAIRDCDVVVGYTEYVRLVQEAFPDKRALSTPMRSEIARCRAALELASEQDARIALVCSGDAGVYGMASPALELAGDYPKAEVRVVSGVSAAQSGAAVLGAPLGHDFVVVSLSDILTPWDVIERRLRMAVDADFAICIYNPRSHRRPDNLRRATRVLREAGAEAERPCGWVRNIGREGQESGILTLSELEDLDADMFTTVFVGSSSTVVVDGRLVTPRGYRGIE